MSVEGQQVKESLVNLPFEVILGYAKNGYKIQRAGWNGGGQFVVMMPALYLPPFNTQGTDRKVNDRTAKWIGEETPLDCQPYFALFNAKKNGNQDGFRHKVICSPMTGKL